MEKKTLQERWIQAMSKVPYYLIGYKGYTEKEAARVCEFFRQRPPDHPRLKTILALEEETRNLPIAITSESTPKRPFTKHDFFTVLKAATKPKTKVSQPNINDYPEPWCTITKDGKFIRYEDANGKPIPEVLWRVRK